MRPQNIDKLIKNIDLKASPGLDNKIHTQIDKAQPNIKPTFAKIKIMRVAAMIAVVALAFYAGIVYKNRAHKQQLTKIAKDLNLSSASELTSYASLSKAFRDGDMEALDKQFKIADKKMSSRLKTRLTIDQLICEFDECNDL